MSKAPKFDEATFKTNAHAFLTELLKGTNYTLSDNVRVHNFGNQIIFKSEKAYSFKSQATQETFLRKVATKLSELFKVKVQLEAYSHHDKDEYTVDFKLNSNNCRFALVCDNGFNPSVEVSLMQWY
jgi:hypothetical protein